MKSLLYLAGLLAAVTLLGPSLSEAGWTCSDKGPCHCKESNFSINIEAVVNKFFLNNNISDPVSNKYSYIVSPCKPISCNLTNPGVDKTASACQIIYDQGTGVKLGEVNQFSWDVEDENHFSITFMGGEPITGAQSGVRQTQFDFTVKESLKEPILEYIQEVVVGNTHTYTFAATISASEENQGGSSPSKAGAIGLVIIALLLLGLLAYFIIGSIIMFQVKGARGSEVIPNLLFWKDLPFLIKDGFMFTISPCRKLTGKGYQSL